jgi:signal transduction histidine kinase
MRRSVEKTKPSKVNNTPAGSSLLGEISRLRSEVLELQLQLEEIEQQHRVEAGTMHDLMAALTRATGLDQTLEIILVNLRSLVPYDLAGLFLLSRDGRHFPDNISPVGKGQVIQTFPSDHPLVAELEKSRHPILVSDIHTDPRFDSWEDIQLIKSWMGVPIRLNGEMIGFLSLGSLQPGTYHNTDAALVTTFTNQLSNVLEEVWNPAYLPRESEKLEVISRLSHALGQAESKEDTYRAILEQISSLFGPVEGAFLFPDHTSSNLIVRFASNEGCLGLSHPHGEDPLWQSLETGKTISIPDIASFLHQSPPELYRALLKRKKSAIIIPLKSQDSIFGILLLAFPQHHNLTSADYREFDTIAQITSTTLRRLFVLEALEKQLSVERRKLIEQAEQAAVMEERQRLARELHDSVTQLIYSQVLYAGAGLKVLSNGDTQLSQQYLSRIHQVARQALKEMRLLVYELRPKDFLEDGLAGALQRRLDSVERRSEINAQLVVQGQIDLDEAAEIALYYIAMEALNNILKHSAATSVFILLRGDGDKVTLEVADDGCGFNLEKMENQGGLGLTSMRERAAAFQGDLEIITHPGQGTRIITTIEGSR